jgi:hypothetical protein
MPVPRQHWDIAFGPLGHYLLQENAALQRDINISMRQYRNDMNVFRNQILSLEEQLDVANRSQIQNVTIITNLQRTMGRVNARNARLAHERIYMIRLLRALNLRAKRLAQLAVTNGVVVHIRPLSDAYLDSLENGSDTIDEEEDDDDLTDDELEV